MLSNVKMFPMWISELSRSSGVPVPTVKYYLREGLLHPGEATSATRAVYDDSHVHRLRLIRALVDVGGLGLDRVRAVIAAIDDADSDLHDVLAMAHRELSPVADVEPTEASRTRVAQLVRRRGWRVTADGRHATALAAALDALDAAGHPLPDDAFAVYADAAAAVAKAEIADMPGESREDAATHAVTGTVLVEPILLVLRRLAQEDRSARRFTSGPQRDV